MSARPRADGARGGADAPCGRLAVKGPADSNSRTPPSPMCYGSRQWRIESTKLPSYNIDMGKTSTDEIGRRLELALKPAEGSPIIEEVLEHVSNHGVLRGPVDWVFPAWVIYVEHATQRIAEAFQLTEEEREQLFDFRDTLKRLLLEAQRQAKAKLTSIYKAVVDGTYRMEGNKLYALDGTWMYVRERFTQHIIITASAPRRVFPTC